MKRPLVGGSLQLCVVEVEIAEPPRNGRLMVPCEDNGCATYISQVPGRTQQEDNRSEANPVGFGEGLPDPCIAGKNIAKEIYDALVALY